MDTRLRIFRLLEYKDFYNVEKSLDDAIKLIDGIPSTTLLNYIAGFSLQIYLHDNDEMTGKIQFSLVSSLLNKCSEEARKSWVRVVKNVAVSNIDPIFVWNLSNLHFYDLIFTNYNNFASRDLSADEAKRVFDAYLIINQLVNSQIVIKNKIDLKTASQDAIEDFVVAKLMYQRDYMSSLDFKNQVNRGDAFFDYLSSHKNYSQHVKKYLKNKGIADFTEMFKALLIIFSKSFGKGEDKGRCQLIDLSDCVHYEYINMDFVSSLCINSHIKNYKRDMSFLTIRNRFLYQVSQHKFILLNINFLYDNFFNSHIFAFHNF